MTTKAFTAQPDQIREIFDYQSAGRFEYKDLLPSNSTPFGVANREELSKMLGIEGTDYFACVYHLKPSIYKRGYYSNQTVETTSDNELLNYPYLLVIEQNYQVAEPTVKVGYEFQTLALTARNPVLLGKASRSYYTTPQRASIAGTTLLLTVHIKGEDVPLVTSIRFAEEAFGLKVVENPVGELLMELSNAHSAALRGPYLNVTNVLETADYYEYGTYRTVKGFRSTLGALSSVRFHLPFSPANLSKILTKFAQGQVIQTENLTGIKKTHQKLVPILLELAVQDPLLICVYNTFVEASARSHEGVKISSIFNEVFKDTTTVDQLKETLNTLIPDDQNRRYYSRYNGLPEKLEGLQVFKDKRRAVLKSQGHRAMTKIMEESESLNIDKDKYPLTWATIEAGKLPLGAFFRKKEQYFLLNDCWDLWEGMFERGFEKEVIELADAVKGRTTYEKDLMSYFYFLLHALPEYLKQQTGYDWKCVPKLVDSATELEPPKEVGGVAKTRSALTPTVDNENKIVTVPYASLAIGGSYGTTYCYSHDYHVLTRGFSFKGYCVARDVEEKLNGRDDYGLMFYTLTGSAQGQGYPTFLIIFERRESKGDVRVHFHRTHPCRSKDGDYNPIHNWTKVCYNWMAGNIRRDRIKAQQGDLAFVEVKTEDSGEDLEGSAVTKLNFGYEVDQYDSHCFEKPVAFAEYVKKEKSNILGYVRLDQAMKLNHTEHDAVTVPAGTFAIHQCRSWEANPKGVWSLRID